MSDSKTDLTGQEICQRMTRWKTGLYRQRLTVAKHEQFFNAGQLPDQETPSLGFAYRYLKVKSQKLASVKEHRPGPVKITVTDAKEVERKKRVERALNAEINKFVLERYSHVLDVWAGRGLLAGKSFLWTPNRWDFIWRHDYLLHPGDAPDDIYDDRFRAWGFEAHIRLSDLDTAMDNAESKAGEGWSKNGLKALKEYIVNSDGCADASYRDLPVQRIHGMSFSELSQRDKLKVYYYFRKNGEYADGSSLEKVDVYIVSRHGETMPESVKHNRRLVTITNKTTDREQIISFTKDGFDSIDECLVVFKYDTRVCGEPLLKDIGGVGKATISRHLLVEHMMHRIAEGTMWGVTLNWTYGGNIAAEIIDDLEASGPAPGQAFPADWQLAPMDKNNSLATASASMNMARSLVATLEQDSGSGEFPIALGQNAADTRFKAEAEALVSELSQQVIALMSVWHQALDKLFVQVVRAICDGDRREHDPRTRDARGIIARLKQAYELKADEFESKRLRVEARRLAGGGDAQTAINRARVILGDPSSPPPPELRAFAYRNLVAALYGDDAVDEFFPDEPPVQHDQLLSAAIQTNAALVAGIALPADPRDEPALHVQFHGQAAQNQLQVAQAQGYRTPAQSLGMQRLLEHARQDMARLPPELAQQASSQGAQLAQAFAQVPEQAATDREERKLALEERQQAFQESMGQNLMQTRQSAEQRKNLQAAHQSAMGEQQFLGADEEASTRAERNRAVTELTQTRARREAEQAEREELGLDS